MLLLPLRETFSFFWQHFTELLWRLIPVVLPLILAANYRLVVQFHGDVMLAGTDAGVLLLQGLSSVAASAFTIIYAFSANAATPPTQALPALWWRAIKRVPSLLVLHLMVGLVLFLVPIILVGAASQVGEDAQAALSFLVLLCVWPILFGMGALSPGYVMAVHEGLNPLAAFKRSWSRFRERAWVLSTGFCCVLMVLFVVLMGIQQMEMLVQFSPHPTRIMALSVLDLIALQFVQLMTLLIVKFYVARELADKKPEENQKDL